MSNMSYCRFQNTLRDLEDCKEALDEIEEEGSVLSEEEESAKDRLLIVCKEIVDEYMDED